MIQMLRMKRLWQMRFSLMSAVIVGYLMDKAWEIVIQAYDNLIKSNLYYDMKIVFAVLNDEILVFKEDTLKKRC